nr:MAG TPA: hypothetical protein [Caudoviricetes sp.]
MTRISNLFIIIYYIYECQEQDQFKGIQKQNQTIKKKRKDPEKEISGDGEKL